MAGLRREEYERLVEHSPVMLWRAELDAGRSYFNAAWLAFTGGALEREAGEGWAQGVHANDRAACRARYRDHVARRQSFEIEYRLRRFDGVYRRVVERGAPFRDAAGEPVGFVGSCLDVEELRAAAGDAPSWHDEFFDMSLDNLGVAGFDGYLKRINPSWTRTLGWTAEELMSRPSVEFVHPEDRERTLAGRHRLRAGEVLGPLINRYQCKDGTYRWFEWRSVASVERGLVYAAARDISEQKWAEERLAEAKEMHEKLQRQLVFADRMASVGTLAAGVAHEINNPLAFVSGNAAMIVEGLGTLGADHASERVLELKAMALDIQTGAERIRKIVRGLKTFSRSEEERLVILNVRRVLELAIDMTHNELRHRARLVTDYGALPLVEADDARLGQVFVNLIVNAAQAIPEGDIGAHEIGIRTSTDAAGCAVIEVRDTGVGMAPEVLGRIFDPFFTTKPVGVGTGLGLSICHNIVAGMGGAITVTSEPRRGTTFCVVLPAAQATRGEAAPPSPSPKVAPACASVLVVDDEPAIGTVLRRVLREHDVTTVTTAREALELLGTGKHFDVVFSDLMMPEMSGMHFYEEVERRFPAAAERVVFVSGGAFTPAAAAFLERVANERIDKPFDPRTVRALVQRFSR